MADITGDLERANVTPDTALTNIKGAAQTGQTPEDYGRKSKEQKLVSSTPSQAPRGVASVMQENPQKAAVIAPDVPKLSWAERFGSRIGLGMKASDISRRRARVANEVSALRAKGQEPSETQLMELDILREDADTVGAQIKELNLGWGSSGVAEIFVSGSDTLKDIWAQKELVAGSTAAGAGVGAAAGTVTVPLLGTFAGAAGGGATGFALGTFGAGFIENKNRYRGETYDELSVLQNLGKPVNLPESTKNNIAEGVSWVGAIAETAADRLLADRIPVLKRILSTSRIREYATDPVVKANIDALGEFARKVGEAGIIEGGTEVFQNLTEKVGTELARTWDGKETSFADALTAVGSKANPFNDKQAVDPSTGQPIPGRTERGLFWEEQAETFTVGAIAGAGFTAAGRGYSAVHDKVFNKNKTSLQQEVAPETLTAAEPGAPVQTSAETGAMQIEPSPGTEALVTDAQGVPTHLNPQAALNFALTVGAIKESTKDTKIDGSPVDAVALQAKMLVESGVREAWVAPEALNKWANTEAKAEMVGKWLTGDKRSDAAIGSRVALDPDQLLEALRTDDSLLADVRQYPDGLSFNEAKELFARERDAAQAALQEQGAPAAGNAPTAESTAEPVPRGTGPADTTMLALTSTDEEILATLGTRQEAFAYYKRLHDEEDRLYKDFNAKSFTAERIKRKATEEVTRFESPAINISSEEMEQVVSERNPELWSRYQDQLEQMQAAQADNQQFIVKDLTKKIEDTKAEIGNVLEEWRKDRLGEAAVKMQQAYAEESKQLQPAVEARNQRANDLIMMRNRIMELANQLPDMEQEARPAGPELTPEEEVEVAFTSYMASPIWTDLIRTGIPSKVINDLDKEYTRIRTDIIEATREVAEKEMNQVVDLVTEIAMVEDAQEIIAQSVNDPNIEVVENFLANYKNLQINPASLSPAQRSRYGSDVVLEKRKVFSKKAKMGPDDLAMQLGVLDGDAALEILSSVPDRAQATKNAQALHEREISEQAAEAVDINSAAIIKAIEDKQKLNIKEFQALVESAWVKARAGIEAVILARVNMDVIRADAKAQIERTVLSQLKPAQYQNASKIARRKALKAGMRGDWLEASRQREIEIKADELYKQALITVGKSNKLIKRLARRLRNATLNETLKNGGGLNAFQELSKIVNLDPNGPESKRGAFERWAKKQAKDQISDPSIPNDLVQTFDPRATPKDLSYEQLAFIFDKQSEIIKSSQDAIAFQFGQETLYKSQMENFIEQELTQDPAYNEKNLEPGHETLSSTKQQASQFFTSLDNKIVNVNYTMRRLVRGNINHPFYQMIYGALKGVGVFDNGFGEKANLEWRAKIRDRVLEKLNQYGKKRIESYGTQLISPPEFKDSFGLLDSQGRMTKLDLMTMLAYYGSTTGRQRIENFQINPDSILRVVERELVPEDVMFIQEAIHDTYDLMRPQIERTMKLLKNEEVEFVEGKPYTVHGIKVRGGYIPLKYRQNLTVEQEAKASEKETDVAIGLADEVHQDTTAQDGFTRQGNMISRVENFDGVLSLNFTNIVTSGLEDTLTTMTMAVPIQQSMRILNNPKNAKHIIAVIGKDRFRMLKANILSTGKSIYSERVALVNDIEKSIVAQSTWMGKNLAKNTLLFVPSTMFMQLTSLSYVWSDLGLAGSAQYGWTAAKILMKPWTIPSVLRFAKELDPSIGEYFNNVDEYNKGGIGDILPTNRSQNVLVRGLETIDTVATTTALKGMLGTMDVAMKVPAAITYYNRLKAGKVKGAEIDGKTDEEVFNMARFNLMARSAGILTSGTALERSYAQKSGFLKDWASYFNDLRNIYNYTMYRVFDQTRWSMQEGRKAYKEGRYKDLASITMGAGGNLMMYQFFASAALTLVEASRGIEDDEGFELTPLTLAWEKEMLWKMTKNFFNPFTTAGLLIQAQPIVRDVMFNLEAREETDGRFVSIIAPLYIRAINNAAAGLAALKNLAIYEGDITEKERRALVEGMGVAIPGFPYRAIIKMDQANQDNNGSALMNIAADPGMTVMIPMLAVSLMSRFITTNDADAYQAAKEIKEDFDPTSSYEQNQIASGQAEPITEYEARIIRFAESSGNDKAQADKSSAAGPYQFVTRTWNNLMKQYPDLGLTPEGRTESVEQQERAFKKLTEVNALTLIRNKIPVNIETIYAMHHFRPAIALSVLKADDKTKLSNLKYNGDKVNWDQEVAANSWLGDGGVSWINGGKPVRTVGQFKQALRDILANGERLSDEALDAP